MFNDQLIIQHPTSSGVFLATMNYPQKIGSCIRSRENHFKGEKETPSRTHSIFHNKFHFVDKGIAFHTWVGTHMEYTVCKTGSSHLQFFSKLRDGQQISMST